MSSVLAIAILSALAGGLLAGLVIPGARIAWAAARRSRDLAEAVGPLGSGVTAGFYSNQDGSIDLTVTGDRGAVSVRLPAAARPGIVKTLFGDGPMTLFGFCREDVAGFAVMLEGEIRSAEASSGDAWPFLAIGKETPKEAIQRAADELETQLTTAALDVSARVRFGGDSDADLPLLARRLARLALQGVILDGRRRSAILAVNQDGSIEMTKVSKDGDQ